MRLLTMAMMTGQTVPEVKVIEVQDVMDPERGTAKAR
jgi:hypothetical protein